MKKIILGLKNDWMAVLYAIMGVLLVLFPIPFTSAIPYMLGLSLIAEGILGIIALYHHKSHSKLTLGNVIVVLVLGSVILFHGAESIGPIGAFWATASLYEVAGEITEAYEQRRFSVLQMLFTIITIVLAVMLMFNPFDHFTVHVRILGLEILSYVIIRQYKLHLQND